MAPLVLHPGASPVYRFLTIIASRLDNRDTLEGKKILECGAGGDIPPVALFAQQGMEAHGIDADPDQLALARGFCQKSDLPVKFRKADMRKLPYDDATFDYVYEHFSLCHLDPAGTAQTLAEMRRVLKPGGVAFCGVISTESWPLSEYGVERSPSVYCLPAGEDGDEECHTILSDQQADALVTDWEILRKERAELIYREHGKRTTEEEWRALNPQARVACSEKDWMAQYPDRVNRFSYVHTYYFLRKPTE